MQSNAVVSPGNAAGNSTAENNAGSAAPATPASATGNLPSDDDLRASGVTLPELHLSLHVYDDVAANISMVLAGIDPQTKAFLEPPAAIKKEIEQVTADKSITENDKKQMLAELNEALKSAVPIQNASNVELVKKYLDKIEAALQ
jgi:hypothetical protein